MLSIPHYVIKKGRCHGTRHGKTQEQKEYHMAWNAWKRCCKKVDSQGELFRGIHFLPPMSVAAMQNFRGVPGVTPQDAAFGKMDVQGTGLVDMYKLADALRVMGKSERDIQQFLKELVTPSPQPYFHDVDAPMVGSKVSVPKLRKAHDVQMSKAQTSWISKNWRMPGARWVSLNVRTSSFSMS